MGFKPVSVLDALPMPIDGRYAATIGPGVITVGLFDHAGAAYAQAQVELPEELLGMEEATRMSKITDAAKTAARLINAWGELANDSSIALGVPVVLDPRVVLKEEL